MHPLTCPAPRPDFESFSRVIRRLAPPARVHQVELFLDAPVKDALLERFGVSLDVPTTDPLFDIKRDIALGMLVGYDLVRIHLPAAEFTMDFRSSADKGSEAGVLEPLQRTCQGYIVHEHGGPVQNEWDFEHYPWPRIDKLDTRPLEWANKHLPGGMKTFDLSAQFFECASWLLGYETLFMKIVEDPDFLDAVLGRIGNIYLDYTRLLCQFDCIGAIWAADDMGHKTGTMVAPEWLRSSIIPWHQRAAGIAHDAGKLYFLHSCGMIAPLMDDFIETIGIDAKHSFEDVVIPVEEGFGRWSQRVGILGGLDVDLMSRSTPEGVRERVRNVLAVCGNGPYALGTGNSVTTYTPVDNYLAMVDEGLRWGR